MTDSTRNNDNERATVHAMVELFCKAHHSGDPLCAACTELIAYADARLAACAFGVEKPVCQKCPVHCYRPAMRERMKEIMRYSGPRMILHHPVMAVRHQLHAQRPVPERKPRPAAPQPAPENPARGENFQSLEK